MTDSKKQQTKVHSSNPAILIVDDDDGLSALMQKCLRAEGFRTARTATCPETLEWFRNNGADLMLLDHKLPDTTGKRLLKQLVKEKYTVPFIVITGHGDEQLAVEMLKCGARDYIIKDMTLLKLLPSVVSRTLRQVEREKKLAQAEKYLEDLAKFASESPFAVMRISLNGTILYANDTSLTLLRHWRCKVGDIVPGDWCKLITEVLDSNRTRVTEVKYGSRILSFVIAPVAKAGYANIYGRDVTEYKMAEDKLKKLNEELEKRVIERTEKLTVANKQLLQENKERKHLEEQLLDIIERERRWIGQELHDSIGQQLTGVEFMAETLQHKLYSKSLDEATYAARITALVNQAAEQMHEFARKLHPVDLNVSNLTSAFDDLAASTEHLFSISCIFKHSKSVSVNDTSVTINLYRIAQEAITNAVRHGGAKNVVIKLTSIRGRSTLTVKSDGLDFPGNQAASKGMGLKLMNHRAETIGGSLSIHRGANGGTIVTCMFPSKKQ
jgi:two-component system sensor histidine kinase UhpB